MVYKSIIPRIIFFKIRSIIIFCLLYIGFEGYSQQNKNILKSIIRQYPQLKEVVEYYKKEGSHKKILAASFLITNMNGKGTYLNDLVDSKENKVGYNISNFKDEAAEKKWLDSVTVVRGILNEKKSFLSDFKNITAQFLINNIDRAFEVREKSPFCKNLTDAEFYEYILPYRVGTEKLEYWRDRVLKDFTREQLDSIYTFSTILSATNYIDKIYQKRFKFVGNRFYKQKNVRSYSELLNDKVGKCDDMCNLMIFVLRAIGIPSGFDGIRYKRASNDVGHQWVFAFDPTIKRNYPFDALSNNGPGFFNLPYKNAPKVLRKQFAIVSVNSIKNNESIIHPDFFENNSLDVTSEYFETTNLNIPLNRSYLEPIYLSIWNNGWWKPVDYFYNINESFAIFKNVSKDNLYCLTKYHFFAVEEMSEPFIVNKLGELKYLSLIGTKKEINLNDYVNKEFKYAKNNTQVLDFDSRDEICRKVIQENLKQDSWIYFTKKINTNTLYHFVDVENKINKIFLLKNDGSVDWY